jgi:hypothetical protein
MSNAMVPRDDDDDQRGAIVREGFGESSIERRGETASTMQAAQAQAEVQAAYIVALQRPRSIHTVRIKLLEACDRPGFAARAFYAVPRAGLKKPGRITGTRGVIEGLSVRFAEKAIQVSGNLRQRTTTIYDDDFKRKLSIQVIDLETNAIYEREILIEKTIERREPKDGQVVLGQRTNSAGATVYIIQASEEELLQKESALGSRIFRTLGLRLVDADILEECEARILATLTSKDKGDPQAARKAMIDNFAKLGVMPDDLVLYLGHAIEQCSPAELMELRGLLAAVHDGEVTMADALKAKTGEVQKGDTSDAAASKVSAVAEKIKARATRIQTAREAKANPAPTTTAAAPAAGKPPAAPAKGSDDALFGPKATAAKDDADAEPPADVKLGDDDDLGGRS